MNDSSFFVVSLDRVGILVPSPEWGSKMGKKHVSTSNIISIS